MQISLDYIKFIKNIDNILMWYLPIFKVYLQLKYCVDLKYEADKNVYCLRCMEQTNTAWTISPFINSKWDLSALS